jgi:protein SCO1
MLARACFPPRLRALAIAIAASTLAGCSGTHPSTGGAVSQIQGGGGSFEGAEIQARPQAPPFTLTNQAGAARSLAQYRGHVVVLSFAYSTCGRTCVLVAQQIHGALDELDEAVPVLLVSAWPSVDTRAKAARFLSSVGLAGRAEYLTGPLADLRAVWHSYRVTPPEQDRAGFTRGLTVLLIDARGRERVAYGLEQLTPEALADDIRTLERG